jgi:hypothetical protein
MLPNGVRTIAVAGAARTNSGTRATSARSATMGSSPSAAPASRPRWTTAVVSVSALAMAR